MQTQSSIQIRCDSEICRVFDVEHWQTKAPFDWISMLNVLDRCDKPKTLLQDIYDSLTPNGVFLLSVVLPFDPIVLKGTE